MNELAECAFGAGGYFLYKSNLISEDDTFQGLKVKHNEKIVLVKCGEVSNIKESYWRRFIS